VAADPMVAELNAQIVGLQLQIRSQAAISKRGRSAGIRRLESQLAQYQQEVAQMRDQLRAQLSGQQSGEPDPLLKSQTVAFTITSQALQGQLAQLTQRLEELKQDLLLKAENNTDLMLKLAEIEHLRRVEQSVADRIQNLQVEVLAPNRVTPVGGKGTGAALAETSQDRNLLARVAIAGIGGLGTLGATMLGIGFMEFTGRRLNGPWQVDEGLGIRVIGTLPRLQGKKALNPKHPIVGQLNESIDSVRTALMHESTAKRRQLVLVTGAETGEGVTTVASQLAASLARAGRRTLLIDGDLRRPALHSLFNSPLEDGLCEVLRAEAEVTDVIRPTPAESLWLMTAGYCDVDAVRALATDQMQPIFEKLRAEYDFIIVNGAPLVGLSDSLLFGQQCDGAILSVLRDRTCVTKLNESAELLRSVGVRIIGAVVNGVAARTDRRVTHLQQVTPKSEQKKLETVDA
ncbi:MAG: polysaccharide biosynthesis tyrosine autokinase, partial [Planctomycetota bacterium]